MGHSTRAAIVRLMRRHGSLSPVQVTRELDGEQLTLVAYHFRRRSPRPLSSIERTICSN
jgi:hypothetical protein